jgi:hypothetical protein
VSWGGRGALGEPWAECRYLRSAPIRGAS